MYVTPKTFADIDYVLIYIGLKLLKLSQDLVNLLQSLLYLLIFS